MDLKALKEKPIAVLGAGGVGKPIAGDSALAGARVRIWDQPEFAKKTLANIGKWGIRIEGLQMNMYSYQRSGFGYPEMVTDNLAEAVKGAGIIVIGIVASAHEKSSKSSSLCWKMVRSFILFPTTSARFCFANDD